MKAMKFMVTTMVLLLMICGPAMADVLDTSDITATGTYNGNLSFITDGEFPSEGGLWMDGTVYWFGPPFDPNNHVNFTFDYGSLYTIEDVVLSVDNNRDIYLVEYSSDGSTWNELFTKHEHDGDQWVLGGMDTLSTISEDEEYVAAIDFNPVIARYLRFSASETQWDGAHSIGEFQVYGSAAPVPEPTTLVLSGLGLLGLAGFLRRQKKARLQ